MEIAIGLFGLFILFGVPFFSNVYTAWGGSGPVGLLFRAVAASIWLLPPTILMGATLPAMSRWVETSPQGVAWLGYFYGGNTGGAVIGSLLAGFYLLRVHDMAIATYVAVLLNLLVGALALLVARATPYEAAVAPREKAKPAPGSWAVYVAIALSGMTALASQVIWTRTLSLLFGATVYTFSLILAVFLFGIGIGSSIGSVMARSLERPRVALGWVQMLLCGAIAWAAYTLALSLPFWPIDPSIAMSPWYNFPLDLARAFWVVLPASSLGRLEGAGPGPAGRWRLRRQHRRRDRRRHRRQSPDGHVARHAAVAAGPHHPFRPGGAARARTAPVRRRGWPPPLGLGGHGPDRHRRRHRGAPRAQPSANPQAPRGIRPLRGHAGESGHRRHLHG
jgi:hypothetical protein